MKVTVNKIYHNTTKRDGTPYLSREGKPYTMCVLDTPQGRIYGYGNNTTRKWSPGQTLDLEIREENGFKKFSLPRISIYELEKRISGLEKAVDVLKNLITGPGTTATPTPTQEPELSEEDYGAI